MITAAFLMLAPDGLDTLADAPARRPPDVVEVLALPYAAILRLE